LRVAFVTVGDTGRLTGGYLYNAQVISGLREAGVEVEEVLASGASVEEQRAAAPQLGSLLDPEHFDALVVDALARVACAPHLERWQAARPLVAMVHELPSIAGGRPAESKEYARDREVEEPLLRAERLICVSRHGRSILEDRGAPASRVRVVPPGFDRLPQIVCEDWRSASDTLLRALCVAQWIPRKGILELVRAWASRERPGALLELVGETSADPGYASEVRAAVAEVSERPGISIAVTGPVDDNTLATAYARADLFALPSHYEGYGIVYAEALAYGLPVLACGVGPVPDLVGEQAALLVPPEDERALSEALDLLLSDAELRIRMSAAARRRTRCLSCWDEVVEEFVRVLKEAAALRSTR
jgi:glycosyltransferase involved in cell wall biosynthesis